uniref:Uncharacterized protein n=1 Tax=Peronospora matthiolae TaxID=2874970 RepID=A0AAV1TVE9_9STRA
MVQSSAAIHDVSRGQSVARSLTVRKGDWEQKTGGRSSKGRTTDERKDKTDERKDGLGSSLLLLLLSLLRPRHTEGRGGGRFCRQTGQTRQGTEQRPPRRHRMRDCCTEWLAGVACWDCRRRRDAETCAIDRGLCIR